MEDKQIVDLFWARSENAISETANKYGKYCHYIAYNILHNNEDSEECVNDTYMHGDPCRRIAPTDCPLSLEKSLAIYP